MSNHNLPRKSNSLWLIVVIFVQKVYDQSHRILAGIPTLKRSQITANLYLGGQYNLRGLQILKRMGITGIINMRITSIYTEARYMSMRYLHLPTPDNTPPSMEALQAGAKFAHDEISGGGKVYIHCRQGQGRGPSMAIAYLLYTGLTYEDAFALVQKVRTFIRPTATQVLRLKELEAFYKDQPRPAEVMPRV